MARVAWARQLIDPEFVQRLRRRRDDPEGRTQRLLEDLDGISKGHTQYSTMFCVEGITGNVMDLVERGRHMPVSETQGQM